MELGAVAGANSSLLFVSMGLIQDHATDRRPRGTLALAASIATGRSQNAPKDGT